MDKTTLSSVEEKMAWRECAVFAMLVACSMFVPPNVRSAGDPASSAASEPATFPEDAASSQPIVQAASAADSQPVVEVESAAGTTARTVRWSGTRDRVYKIFVSAGGLLGGACLPCLGCAGTAFVGSPELTMFSFALAPQLGMVLGTTAVALFFGDPVRALSAGLLAVLVGGAVSAAGFGALMLLGNAVDDLSVQGAAGYAWLATPLLASALTLTAFHVAFLWLLERTPLQTLFAGRLATDEQESSEPGERSLPGRR